MDPLDFNMILRRMPFRPFRVRLTLDLEFEIRHPEMAALEFSTVVVQVDNGDETVLSLSHIVAIEYLPVRT